jgi:hypothetical protein
MAGIDGLDAGDVVTAAQMKALYGLGLRPLAAERDAEAGRLGFSYGNCQRALQTSNLTISHGRQPRSRGYR